MDTCVHSCKGLCTALSVAERREEEAIKDYQRFAEGCEYPDVRSILEKLIRDHQRGLETLQQAREMLEARFFTVDRINDNFA